MSSPDDTAVPLPWDWAAGYADYRQNNPFEFLSIEEARQHYAFQAGRAAEDTLRQATPGSFLDNFIVGLWRIGATPAGIGVGATDPLTGQHNQTFGGAWTETDDNLFAGWAPGGAPPENPFDLLPFDLLPPWVLPLGLGVGALVLLR